MQPIESLIKVSGTRQLEKVFFEGNTKGCSINYGPIVHFTPFQSPCK